MTSAKAAGILLHSGKKQILISRKAESLEGFLLVFSLLTGATGAVGSPSESTRSVSDSISLSQTEAEDQH